MSKDELKPCPFCNSEVKLTQNPFTEKYFIYCTNHDCYLSDGDTFQKGMNDLNKLKEKWNKRDNL